MSHPSLTPAQAERLELLAEEAAEVVQIAMKSLRHGLDSYHPDDPERKPNRELLRREIADFHAAISLLYIADDMKEASQMMTASALKRKLAFLHHQGDLDILR